MNKGVFGCVNVWTYCNERLITWEVIPDAGSRISTFFIGHIDCRRPPFHKTTKATHHTQNLRTIPAPNHPFLNPVVRHPPPHTSTSIIQAQVSYRHKFSRKRKFAQNMHPTLESRSRACACIEVRTGSMYPGVPVTRVASTSPSRVLDLSRPKSATLA